MDIRKIKKLIEMLEESQLSEIEITEGEESIRLSRGSPSASAPVLTHPITPVSASLEAVSGHVPEPATPAPEVAQTYDTAGAVCSPMVGTFYRAPAPGEPAFVEVGSRINVGQTVCILEAMKLMNELESEVGGEVVEILVDNGTPVEFGQVLMRVKPA